MRNGLIRTAAAVLGFLLLSSTIGPPAIAQTPQKCDVNGDGFINQTDINAIIAARNQPASGPSDPRDPDNNGVINAIDARTCQQRCTLAGCALPPNNTAPVATNDAYSTAEDTIRVVAAPGVLGNDSDAQGNALTAAVVTGPSSGTLVLSTNGSFSYMPAPNFAGPVTFSYRANDGALNSNVATVTLNVTSVNDGPVAVADGYTVAEDAPMTVAAPGVLGNDSDPDNATLSAVLVSGPAANAGTLTLASNGSFTFTSASNFSGTATFSYRASDGTLLSNVTTVTITVTSVNDAPVANADAYSTDEDTPLTVAAAGVLGNDTDPEGGGLTAVLGSPPATGTLVLSPNGSFTYTPAANFNGPTSFTYRASDGVVTSTPATVSLTILPRNDAPVAVNDSYSTAANTSLVIAGPGVLANDTDQEGNGLSGAVVTGPASGALNFNAIGGFTYTPNANFTGSDSFTYRANDGFANSNLAMVSITVTQGANTAPTAFNESHSTLEDTPLTVAAPGVLGNDTDAQGDPLTAVLVTPPASGSFNLNANGGFSYTAAANFNGGASFTYRANDGALNSNIATVTINVTPVNDAPVATNDSYTTAFNTALTVAAPGVLGNDTDVEGSSLTAVLASQPASGTLSLQANGSFTFTPANGFSGPVTFTYRAFDGSLNSSIATVTIVVAASTLPTVTVTATMPNASETGPVNGVFTFTRSSGGNPAAPLTVGYTIGGTATSGVDYNGIGASVTIPANQATATVTIVPVVDALVETSETVIVTIAANASSYVIGAPSSAAVTIANAPTPSVSVVATTPNASETGPASGLFTFTRSAGGNPAASLTVSYTVGGSATSGVDYNGISASVTIPANQTTATVTIVPVVDAVVETSEAVVLTIVANTSSYVIGSQSSATVTIADAVTPSVSITATTPNANEAGPVNGVFRFTRSAGGNPAAPLTVSYTIGGTATNGVDYNGISASVTIPASQTTATVTIVPVADAVVETSETVVLTIGANASSYVIGSPSSATVSIADPSIPSVSVVATTPNASESGPVNGVFTFTRSAGGNPAAALAVSFTIGGTASNGVDYNGISASVSIPANQTTATVNIVPVADSLVEPSETVILTITANAAFTIGSPSSATVTIADAPTPSVSVAATTPNASESGQVNGVFTFTRSAGGNPAAALGVSFTIGGTASNGVDYSGISASVTIPANQTTATVNVVPVVDALVESSETVVLTITPNAASYIVGSPSTATVTIADASTPSVSVVATTPNANETGPVNGLFTFTRSAGGNSAASLTVSYTIGGTATNGVDYNGISASVIIPANQTTATVNIVPIANAPAEGTETVILTITANAAYSVGAPASATVMIADPGSDAAPSVLQVDPANGSNTAPFASNVTVFFNEYVQVTGTWFQIVCSNSGTRTPANSTVTANAGGNLGTAFTIDPNAVFTQGESCTGTIFAANVGDYDTDDPPDKMAANFTWTFSALTDAAPSVIQVDPANGSNTAPFASNVTVFFNEYVQVTGTWFQIVCSNSGTRTPANSTVTANAGGNLGTTFTIDPNAVFTQGESCTGTIFAANVGDYDTDDPPDKMAANFTWTFSALTDAAPSVIQVDPANGSNTAPFASNVTVFFNEYVQVTGTWFQIVCSNSGTRTPANSTVTANAGGNLGTTFTIDPNAVFTQGESCTGTIFAANVGDYDTDDPPDKMAANFTWTFSALTDAAPSVIQVDPANGSNTAPFASNVTVFFNEYVQVTGTWFQIVCSNSGTRTPANSTVTANAGGNLGTTFTIDPNAVFTQGESCTGTIFAANVGDYDTDDPPDKMAANFTWTFSALTDAAPSVIQVDPANGSNTAPFASNVTVFFNEYVQVTGTWFQIVCSNSGTRTPANSTVTANAGGNLGTAFTIDPNAVFTQGESCTGTIFAANVGDYDTDDPPDKMTANFTWTFNVAP